MTAPTVSIIVVSYNTREMTLECLRSVVAETLDESYELIVVDNASDDGSAEAIAAEFPQVRLVASDVNHGFAAANNIAARDAAGEYLLLLNPDTTVLERAIDRLIAFSRDKPEAGIWGGRTFFADGSLNPTNCWRRQSLWNVFCRSTGLARVFSRSELFNAEGYGGWDRSEVREVDIVTGCFLLIRRTFWERLGGFDPTFVMYGEEADLCLRARAFGAATHVTPDAKIVHYGGASEKVRADKMVRLFRAKITLIRRHFPAISRSPGYALFALWPLSRSVLLGALAAAGRDGLRDEAAVWREIWRRRGEWLGGYPDRTAA